jgi:hypothetical protein
MPAGSSAPLLLVHDCLSRLSSKEVEKIAKIISGTLPYLEQVSPGGGVRGVR